MKNTVTTFAVFFASLSAHAGLSDFCQSEAIRASQIAFAREFHVNIETVRKLTVSVHGLESPYYAYVLTINKGSNISGAWKVLLGQQCEVKRIVKAEFGDRAQ